MLKSGVLFLLFVFVIIYIYIISLKDQFLEFFLSLNRGKLEPLCNTCEAGSYTLLTVLHSMYKLAL